MISQKSDEDSNIVSQLDENNETESVNSQKNNENPLDVFLRSEMELLESVKDYEDLVFESLAALYEHEEVLFNNFTLLTTAMGILFMLLKQYPISTSKINNFIKEKVLKTWRLKQKSLAKSLSSSSSPQKSSTSSSTHINQNRRPISGF